MEHVVALEEVDQNRISRPAPRVHQYVWFFEQTASSSAGTTV
jgi:hypothetical protein